MTPITRRRALAALSLSPLALQPGWALANAANWPDKPVRLVIPAPPGGGTDVMGRLLGDALSKQFKQAFFIDNKPGANGLLASEFLARAPADGHTLLLSYAAAIAVNPSLYTRAPDPLKALAPVAQVGAMGNVLLCTPDFPARNLGDLVKLAGSKPLNYGTWGVGSGGHLTMEDFLGRAKVTMTHAPYKGVAPVVTDLLSNVLPLGWTDVSSVVPHVQSGKLRALAVSGPARLPLFAQVPTMREQGYPFDTTSWYGLFAPAGTDPAILQRLNAAVVASVKAPEFRERLQLLNMGDSPTPDVAGFRQVVADDLATWGAIVRRLGIKPE